MVVSGQSTTSIFLNDLLLPIMSMENRKITKLHILFDHTKPTVNCDHEIMLHLDSSSVVKVIIG